MKVMIVNRYMGLYGGAETVVKELTGQLTRRGVKTLIVTLNISDTVRELCKDMEIVTPKKFFPYKFRSTDILSSLGIIEEIVALRQLVKAHAGDYDVINVHNFPADWVAGGLKKPVVWMCNEVPDFYNNPKPSSAIRLLRSAGIGLDRYIVNSCIGDICVADEFNAGKVRQRYNRQPRVIPYGIEYDFFAQAEGVEEVRQEYRLQDNFVLLQVGMLSPEKNQMKSIQAVDELRKEIPDVKLILAGRPQNPYGHILKEYVSKRNLDSVVTFTGHISREKVRSLYYASDVALFPVKTQGGWLSPFEALSAGRPIITSTTMGAAGIIDREKLGVVSDDIVSSVKTIHGSYGFYEAGAQKARQWVAQHLTWESFAGAMLSVFEEALHS